MARIDDFNRIVQNITRNQNMIDTIAQAAKLGTSYLNQIPYELLTPSYIDTITNAQALCLSNENVSKRAPKK